LLKPKSSVLILLYFLICFVISPISAFSDSTYDPSSLELSVYSDGIVTVNYGLEVDILASNLSVPIFGDQYQNLIILDKDDSPLDYDFSQNELVIDSLGADFVNISYETYDITNRDGKIWSLNINTLIETKLILPKNAVIISINQIPANLGKIGERTVLTLSPGTIDISYVIDVSNTREYAVSLIRNLEKNILVFKNQDDIPSQVEQLLEEARVALDNNEFERVKELTENAKIILYDSLAVQQIEDVIEAAVESSEITQTETVSIQSDDTSAVSTVLDNIGESSLSLIIIIGVVGVCVVIGVIFLLKSKKKVNK